MYSLKILKFINDKTINFPIIEIETIPRKIDNIFIKKERGAIYMFNGSIRSLRTR